MEGDVWVDKRIWVAKYEKDVNHQRLYWQIPNYREQSVTLSKGSEMKELHKKLTLF